AGGARRASGVDGLPVRLDGLRGVALGGLEVPALEEGGPGGLLAARRVFDSGRVLGAGGILRGRKANGDDQTGDDGGHGDGGGGVSHGTPRGSLGRSIHVRERIRPPVGGVTRLSRSCRGMARGLFSALTARTCSPRRAP